jgi:phosphatidylserine/phosphatidylglycerophosphate/cardiolipin synthase-like enzyme
MKINKRFLLVFLTGVLLGIVLGVEVVHLAEGMACPRTYCVDHASIIPISDRGYFPAVHDALQKADRSIHIAAFELKYYTGYPESNENTLVNDLIEAKNRGVEVMIIVDEYSDENNAFEYLRENDIPIKYDKKDVTTHAKLIIIDGKIVVLGSTNFSYYGLERNREVDVIIFAEHIADYFERYFQELWNGG